MKKPGKIIAVVGAPATGKSTLVKLLKKEFGFYAIFEGEENDVPGFIKENINKDQNGLQTIVWFHNRLIEQYLKAIRLKNSGKTVVLDTFWLSNIFYISTMLKDKDEQKISRDMIKTVEKLFAYPDIIIYLKSHEKTIKDWMTKRGRSFEKEFQKHLKTINREHENFFGNKKIINGAKIIKIDISREAAEEVIKKLKLK